MFRNQFKNKCFTILSSFGPSPLKLWSRNVKNGFIRRITDKDSNSLALEISGVNVSTTYIHIPHDTKNSLGIDLPFLVMIIKNMRRYFTFEITVLDDKGMNRRFRMSNFVKSTSIQPFGVTMPLYLKGGWVQIQLNIAALLRRAYGSNYVETSRMQINANCRIYRIFFSDRLYNIDELPKGYSLSIAQPKCPCANDKKNEKVVDTSKNQLSSESKLQLSAQQDLINNEKPQDPSASTSDLLVEETEINPKRSKLDIHIPTADYEKTDDEEESDEDEKTENENEDKEEANEADNEKDQNEEDDLIKYSFEFRERLIIREFSDENIAEEEYDYHEERIKNLHEYVQQIN